MSLETELTAILTTAAIAPITDRAFLRITGPDATRWLNGMVTNNIKDLAPGQGNYNFLLNAQGRIQGDCTIYREPDENEPVFLLETDSSQLETIRQLLDKFIIMDDVELEVCRPRESFLLLGPQAAKLLPSVADAAVDMTLLADSVPPAMLSFLNGVENWFSERVGLVPAFTWDSMLGLDGAMLHDLRVRGAVEVSPAALEAYRILSGTPRYGTDIRNTDTARDLPQETAQIHALNFNKGCYLGQEIVERIHSRGQVHRTFARFELTGDLPPLPCQLTLDGKQVGELTSAALIPLASGPTLRALGYIRREAATATLTYPGGTATVLDSKPL